MKRNILLTLMALLFMSVSPVHGQNRSQIVIGTLGSITSFDPADSYDFATWELLSHLYTGLTRRLPGTSNYELALAATHKVAPDGLSHTFTLQPDAAFSDGTPITARTFADSINRVLSLQGKAREAVAPYLKGVEVSPAGELILILARPLPYLLELLALPPFFPVHPALYPADRLITSGSGIIGNGIYRISELQADQITLEADPAWRGTPPFTSVIVVRRYDFPADLRDAALRSEVDMVWRGLSAEDSTQVTLAAPDIQILRQNVPGAFYLVFSIKEKPYNEPAARVAFTHLLDRKRALKMGYGEDVLPPLLTLLPPSLVGSVPTFPEYDLKAAAAFLRQNGYSPYKRIESELQSAARMYGDDYGTAVNALITEINRGDIVRVGRFDTETQTFLEQLERGTFRLILIGWTPLVEHPDAYLRPLLSGIIALGAGYQNETITSLLDQAALNPPNAATLYAKVQMLALEDSVVIPLWERQGTALVGARVDVASVNFAGDFRLHYELLRLK